MNPPRQTNRVFGLTFAVVFLVIASVGWLVFDVVWQWALVVSASFLAIALVWPGLLLVPNLLWRQLAGRIAVLNSFLLLGAVYYLVIAPVGLLMRVFRRDSMTRSFQEQTATYLTPVRRQVTAETLGDQF